jgi:uncharacterized protein YyaL (SSP411 family)
VWLERAERLTREQIKRFWDEPNGAFFESPLGDASVRVRMKDGFDGAEMAGNSIAAWNLQTLAVLCDRDEWRVLAARALDYYARRLGSGGAAMPQMLVAFDLARSSPRHVVVAGSPGAADTRALIAEFDRRFLPHDALIVLDGGASQKDIAKLLPWTSALASRNGKATAYVCVNYACRLPVTDPAAFGAQLDEGAARAAHPETR